MTNIHIGDTVTIKGITGKVRGVERADDETVVGILLQSYQIQHPYNLAHFKIEKDHSWEFRPDLALN